jgi:hypothetical protein
MQTQQPPRACSVSDCTLLARLPASDRSLGAACLSGGIGCVMRGNSGMAWRHVHMGALQPCGLDTVQ